jgi:hypothetical protein
MKERSRSNSTGVCRKTTLNELKMKAGHLACLKQFPLEQNEQAFHDEKDMQNAFDLACQKSKLRNDENTRPILYFFNRI